MQDESQVRDDSGGDFHILRVGWQKRANLMPLLYPLETGWVGPESPWKLEVVNGTPAALLDGLLDGLLEGRLDAAFVTPVAVSRHGERLATLGGWGLASEGASGTALLLAPQRLDLMDGADVFVSPEAQGSTAEYLLRILLKPYYDIALSLHSPGDPAYNPKGPRLLYGDDAVMQARKEPAGWVAEDLGVAWYVYTGVSLVWEMLAAPRDLEARKPGAGDTLKGLMRLSRRTAQEQAASVLDEANKRTGIAQTTLKEIFARQRYTLGEPDQKALGRFLDLVNRNA